MPPPTPLVVPLHGHASSHNMGSGSASSRGPRHAGTHPDYQPHLNVLNTFPPRQQGQPDSVHWNSRGLPAGPPFGHSPSQSQAQTTYFGSGAWRVPGTPSLNLQSSPYNPNYPVQQTNGMPFQSPSESAWSTSPYSTTDPRQVEMLV
ncbi:hypothetical protein PENSPDRAFT_681340 [Peniophora sp. CONT]|nr:hypothetical protein PENSPDRAFT_681340 [Peniophora sp. CONT]